MTNYKMQYWLYAILNKQFGKEVRLRRDSLHSCYSVNRHGFTVTTNTMSLTVVCDKLVARLLDGGYALVVGGLSNTYIKIVGGENRYVSIHKRASLHGAEPYLEVCGSIYK